MERVNLISSRIVTLFSLLALATVGAGYLVIPRDRLPEPDEGALAHIFQLSVVAAFVAGLVFLASADWSQPARAARRLTLPALALMLAFGALYYLEHR
jgi:hypothetical protein